MDHHKRPSSGELLKHSFFHKNSWADEYSVKLKDMVTNHESSIAKLVGSQQRPSSNATLNRKIPANMETATSNLSVHTVTTNQTSNNTNGQNLKPPSLQAVQTNVSVNNDSTKFSESSLSSSASVLANNTSNGTSNSNSNTNSNNNTSTNNNNNNNNHNNNNNNNNNNPNLKLINTKPSNSKTPVSPAQLPSHNHTNLPPIVQPNQSNKLGANQSTPGI